MRKIPLVEGKIYHIFSKSIAGFKIFGNDSEYERMRNMLRYYKVDNSPLRFSAFLEIKNKELFFEKHFMERDNLVEIIAYCFMPTHIHLILKQVRQKGISIFMNNILNSYTRYFNVKIKRKGPLWESRFKNVLVKTDEQFLHLTRYLHLNPVTAYLVERPEHWSFSSYKEFLGEIREEERLCNYSDVLNINPKEYKKFVKSQIDYQRELAEIKELFLE
ncbi:MAG: transposase [Candidatus Omnitrophica bacterium]|nr:transposase [Candidatus Omnitrophota bacterium]MBU0879098.1 transposase [Candidatus Omnitrophota bacterium]MBU1134646.1 transposase [Candidatus Omnitrophota bacterium]MBU1367032.1 transposase [Candidatus Omnitrophota bacterium]MBU1523649.1 transposase [Candidatus Omnitrophota bacterium]